MTTATETRTPSPYEVAADANRERAMNGLDRLRVNRASLMAEARILRTLARKRKGLGRHALNAHRTGRLREQARSAHIAWGYALGRTYAEIEGPQTRKPVDRKAVEAKVSMMRLPTAPLASWLPEA